jgi:hypothetical protein
MALVDNLVAYYALNTGALTTDSSGGGFTLTNHNSVAEGTAFLGTTSADFGTANTNKNLRIDNNLGATGSVSVSLWIKMRTEIASGTNGIFCHGVATTNVHNAVAYQYNGGTRRLAFNRQRQNTSNNVFYHTATLGTANWHHIVYTYDGSTMKGYYDGTEVVSQALSGNGASGGLNNFTLGWDRGVWVSSYASAEIDEAGVWSRAITGAEVTSLYNGGVGLAYPFTTAKRGAILSFF